MTDTNKSSSKGAKSSKTTDTSKSSKTSKPSRKGGKPTPPYHYSITKLRKAHFPHDCQMSSDASYALAGIAVACARHVCNASQLSRTNAGRKTISHKEISLAFNSFLPETLRKKAASKYESAQKKFTETQARKKEAKESSDDAVKTKASRIENQCDLILSVSTSEDFIRESGKCQVLIDARICLTAYLETLIYEIMKVAVKNLEVDHHKTMNTRDIYLGCMKDEDLSSVYNSLNIEIHQSGVVPGILPELKVSDEVKEERASRRMKEMKEGKKKTRAHPGDKAEQDIKELQNTTGIQFQQGPFDAEVRRLISEQEGMKDKIPRLSSDAKMIMMSFAQKSCIDLVQHGLKNAVHANRQTLEVADLDLARAHLHPRMTDDGHFSIRKNSLERVCRKAGAKRVSPKVYEEELPRFVYATMKKLLYLCVENMQHRGHTTISGSNVTESLYSGWNINYIYPGLYK